MKNKDSIEKYLKQEAKKMEIPDGVKPEQMRAKLEEHMEWNKISMEDTDLEVKEEKKNKAVYLKVLAAAACICVVFGGVALANRLQDVSKSSETAKVGEESPVGTASLEPEEIEKYHVTYEEVYASMNEVWMEENSWLLRGDAFYVEEQVEMESLAEAPAAAEPAADAPASDGAVEEPTSGFGMQEDGVMQDSSEESAYGTTNVQTVGVDEGDIVKNDGRYLYQIITDNATWPQEQEIQIVDTVDGLKELTRIGGFEFIKEFYVWEDVLVVIENKYLDQDSGDSDGRLACYDVAYFDNTYHEISLYDLTDRTSPEEIKTFTLQGSSGSSRIADGYFYGFSRYYASPGEGEEDYDAYIPILDGERLEANDIFLPKESKGTSYLVLVSIDLRSPTEFVQTAGIVSDSDQYYVSGKNIYVTYTKYDDIADSTGWNSDKTALMRFAYGEGKFELQAEGEIKGHLNDTFSLDEYNDHLRVVTTVREYKTEQITDDRTGEVIGNATTEERQTNALYVLDKNLNLTGKIEGLAEDEQIYSARFMGETGYFVTFRQVDPLFAVDLTDPANPKVLSELKVSGFSEYLHFYGEDRLFGLGVEADEETGMQECMKLSMFDISDPADVQEITRLPLEVFYYSEALYNHHAVLIHPDVNLIGFEAEGYYDDGYKKEYLVFSYENDAFVQKFKLNTEVEDGGYYNSRGTFIGEVFYLLAGDGSVKSYDLNTGNLLESLVSGR